MDGEYGTGLVGIQIQKLSRRILLGHISHILRHIRRGIERAKLVRTFHEGGTKTHSFNSQSVRGPIQPCYDMPHKRKC